MTLSAFDFKDGRDEYRPAIITCMKVRYRETFGQNSPSEHDDKYVVRLWRANFVV